MTTDSDNTADVLVVVAQPKLPQRARSLQRQTAAACCAVCVHDVCMLDGEPPIIGPNAGKARDRELSS
jgi:hypothetical protein